MDRKDFEKEFGKVICSNCNTKIHSLWDGTGKYILACNCSYFDFNMKENKKKLEENDYSVLKDLSPFWKWKK